MGGLHALALLSPHRFTPHSWPESVRALAAALGYNKGVVSRDLQTLAHLDVVEYDESGRAKTPRLKHRHVTVEPIV